MRKFLGLAAILALTACGSSEPVKTIADYPKPPARLEMAGHWSAAAQEVALELGDALRGTVVPSLAVLAGGDTINPFDEAFATALTTELVRQGYAVREDNNAHMVVSSWVQPVARSQDAGTVDVMVTVSATRDGWFVYRLARTYAVPAAALGQYAPVELPGREMKVVGQ